ncbi:MAG TPA: DegT/DnrJ/EryC1/StrS family aminotransferase [Candidatus Paceibacterota bacterium]|nr:DegT/DnrJ/EryC1/StrS family aminotransferase [Candidatus Paceibacterota bacterium]
MLTLLPNEHWDFSLRDTFLGLLTALARQTRTAGTSLPIPELGLCLAVRSARAAIVLALKALALPPGARIGVPLYCCPVVFKAIHAAGYKARFLDVDTETYCLSPADLAAKRSEVDAVIAVHMFGNVCDMPRLREEAPRKPFIEDCAQSIGSRMNGSLAGSFGEIAVFSFRLGKYFSVGEGGALYTGATLLHHRLSEIVSELPAAGRIEECCHVGNTYLRSLLRTKPLWGLLGMRVWRRYNQRVKYEFKSPLVLGRIYETDRAATVRRLPLLDEWIKQQRMNAEFYLRNLAVDAGMLCTEKAGAFYNRLQFPLLTASREQCDQLAACLYENNISTTRPYKDIAEVATTHYGYTGDCPQAERIAKTVIVIPCNYFLKQTDVQRVSECVNRAWAQITGRRPRKSLSAMVQNEARTATRTV